MAIPDHQTLMLPVSDLRQREERVVDVGGVARAPR